jgi:predicted transcriptional regulator
VAVLPNVAVLYTVLTQGLCLLGSRLGVFLAPPGLSFTNDHTLSQVFTKHNRFGKIFRRMHNVAEVNVKKLRELRLNQGYSARRLSKVAGLADTAVWMIETRGSGNPETLKKIADILGVKVVDLLED